MTGSVQVQQQQTRPLSTAKAGESVRVVRIDAGRGLNSRLASMGLVANAELRVVSNGHPGPFVLIVKEAKVVLGRGVAQKIVVR
jgi:Fe2+ transport system protein FeoA